MVRSILLAVMMTLGCADKGSPSVREKELEVELAKANEARAQAELERAKVESASATATPAPAARAISESEQAAQARRDVEAAVGQAIKDAREANERLEALSKDVADLDAKVSTAVAAVVDSQNDADRAAATARLKALQREKAELDQRVADARAAAERAQRLLDVKLSKKCLNNPLAKGCS